MARLEVMPLKGSSKGRFCSLQMLKGPVFLQLTNHDSYRLVQITNLDSTLVSPEGRLAHLEAVQTLFGYIHHKVLPSFVRIILCKVHVWGVVVNFGDVDFYKLVEKVFVGNEEQSVVWFRNEVDPSFRLFLDVSPSGVLVIPRVFRLELAPRISAFQQPLGLPFVIEFNSRQYGIIMA